MHCYNISILNIATNKEKKEDGIS